MIPAMTSDTIFAPATAQGRAGVAVLRISGPAAAAAVGRLTGKPCAAPRLATRARFRDPVTGETLEDGLCLWFPGPASFTGEDVAEFHIHGGRAGIEAMAAALGREAGLRLAEPGEFSRRAFENGKLDLTAAEGLADLVDAETEIQHKQALRQLDGELGRIYESWRQRLIAALAGLEAHIDFPEEGLPKRIVTEMNTVILSIWQEITQHLGDNRRGERVRNGVHVAIIGPTNVGKSSLLNAVVRRDAAIVATAAGTTRDVIEVRLDLAGYPVVLCDTAGLRNSGDAVEREGVARARARAASADFKLLVLDAACATAPEATILDLMDSETIMVINKIDLVPQGAAWAASVAAHRPLAVSVRTGAGLDRLLDDLGARVSERFRAGGAVPLTRQRHRQALEDCVAALDRAAAGKAEELVAEDLRLAVRAVGRITGRVGVEDVLDVIFRDFCIGK